MSEEPNRYTFGPHPQAGWLLGLRGSQCIGLLGAMFATIVAGRLSNGSLFLVLWIALIVAFTLLIVAVDVAGHTIVEWVPVVGRYLLLRATRTDEFVSEAGSYVSVIPDSPGLDPQDAEPCVSLPAELSDVEMLETTLPRYGGAPLAVVFNQRELTYTATVRTVAKAFYLLGQEEREHHLAQWGGLLAGFARDGSPVRRLAWYQRTFLGQPWELIDYYREHRQVEEGSRQDQAMWQLLEAQGAGTPDRELFLSVQIDLRRIAASSAAARLGGGKAKNGALALVGEVTAKLVDDLGRLGLLGKDPVPTARELAQIIRDGVDPFTRSEREHAPDGQPPGIEPQAFGPGYRHARPSYVIADMSLHRSGHLREWPKTDVRATFMQALLMNVDATRTVSVVMEILPPRQATRKVERAAEGRNAERTLRQRIGRRTTSRDRQQDRAAARREDEIADGHGLVKYSGHVTVTVPAEEEYGGGLAELDAAWVRVAGSASNSSLRLVRETCQQDQAMTHTLVGLCRGLV